MHTAKPARARVNSGAKNEVIRGITDRNRLLRRNRRDGGGGGEEEGGTRRHEQKRGVTGERSTRQIWSNSPCETRNTLEGNFLFLFLPVKSNWGGGIRCGRTHRMAGSWSKYRFNPDKSETRLFHSEPIQLGRFWKDFKTSFEKILFFSDHEDLNHSHIIK